MKGTVTTDISRVQVLFAENSFVGWGISWGFSQTSLSHPKRRWWLFSRRNSFCMCGSLNEKECAHTRHYLSLKSSKKSGKSNQASMQGTSFSASQRMSVELFSIKLSPSRLVATESKRNQSFAHMKREKKIPDIFKVISKKWTIRPEFELWRLIPLSVPITITIPVHQIFS